MAWIGLGGVEGMGEAWKVKERQDWLGVVGDGNGWDSHGRLVLEWQGRKGRVGTGGEW